MDRFKKIIKSKWFIRIAMFILIASIAFYIYSDFISGKGRANNVVEDYLEAVENGDDVSDYLDIGVEGFINVFEYDYLKELDIPKEKDTYTYDYEDYEYEKENFDEYADMSFDEYKESQKELYPDAEIIYEDSRELEMWVNEEYEEKYSFLYDVTIANELGQKLYKKVEIDVRKNAFDEYVITNIYIR